MTFYELTEKSNYIYVVDITVQNKQNPRNTKDIDLCVDMRFSYTNQKM